MKRWGIENVVSRGRRLGAVVLASCLVVPAVALAEEMEDESVLPGSFSGNAALVSDYIFRGVSQTGEDPAIQGGIDWSLDVNDSIGIFAGIWGSSIKFAGDNSYMEQDIYGGLAGSAGDLAWDLGFYYFWYPKEEKALNYIEIGANLGYEVGPLALGAGFVYSPAYFGLEDADGDDAPGFVFGGTVGYVLPLDLPIEIGIDGGIEYTTVDTEVLGAEDSYLDWQAGVTLSADNVGIDLRYHDTDVDDVDDADARFVYGISYSF